MISDKEARDSLLKLVEHVVSYQGCPIPSISYQELAFRIGRLNKHGQGHGHGMGGIVLKKMGHILRGIEVGWGEPIPHIQCLVGEKNDPKCLPEDGIREFWPEYDKLISAEKEVRVNLEKKKVSEYGSRWNNVLKFLKIGEVRLPPDPHRAFGNGGESPKHKALKEYVANNPARFGVERPLKIFQEYPLPSLDTLDVLFKEELAWTAIEVKSSVSDSVVGDYERGLYQVVKYKALLEAMKTEGRFEVPNSINVILVLESELPATLKLTAKLLGIQVVDNVKPVTP